VKASGFEMNVITVVKYKVKDGFEQNFVDAINAYNYSNSISMRLISLPDNEYMSIMEYEEIDKTSADEETGVNWLDTVEHMLVLFGESRTEACSGIVVADYDQP
jgi:hypothetical protein